MSFLRRFLPFLSARETMKNPAHPKMRKLRGKKSRPTIKGGRFARKIIRAQLRQHRTYVPGQLGFSDVSMRIKQQYGTLITRRERRRLAAATKTPLRLFYNYPTQFRSKGGKAQ